MTVYSVEIAGDTGGTLNLGDDFVEWMPRLQLTGDVRGPTWDPPVVWRDRDPTGQDPDVWWLPGAEGAFVANPGAQAVLREHLEGVEALPVIVDLHFRFWLWNVTRVVSCLDIAEYDGPPRRLTRFHFDPEALPAIGLFKIPETALTDIYYSETSGIVGLRQVFADAGVTGLAFEPIWSLERGAVDLPDVPSFGRTAPVPSSERRDPRLDEWPSDSVIGDDEA
jgi:hypothetical protein